MFKKTKPKKEEKKPQKKELSENEFEKRVVELSEKSFTSEKIGEMLRKEGIHPKEHGKKISKILREKNLYVNPDLKNVDEKLKRIRAHFEKNKNDKRAMRERERTFSHLRKLKKYFKISQ
ncbi:MAG: hypothetical protein ABIH49_01370 [archaeon]